MMMSSMRMTKKKDLGSFNLSSYNDTDPLMNKLLDIQKKQAISVSDFVICIDLYPSQESLVTYKEKQEIEEKES